MIGWIRLYRSLAEHPVWTRERFTRGQAFVDLIMRANFHEGKVLQGNVWIPVKRGQVFTSQVALATRWRWNRKTVVAFLSSLKADNMLDIETSRRTDTGYTLLTIRNYERYQGPGGEGLDTQTDAQTDIRADIKEATKGQRVPTSEEVKKNKRGAKRPQEPSDAAPRSNDNGKVPPGYQEAVDHWFQEFQRTQGGKPHFDQAEGANLKRLLKAHALAQVKAVMTHTLTRTQHPYIRQRHAYTLHTLIGCWNELWSEYRKRATEEGEPVAEDTGVMH